MKTTLNPESIKSILAKLQSANTECSQRYAGVSGRRQPVQVLYGGAHLFKFDAAQKLSTIAQRMQQTYLPDAQTLSQVFLLEPSIAAIVWGRLTAKLAWQPIEDLRIDFEDGYGFRPNDEEDGHAVAAAIQTALALESESLPPFFGIRIKPLNAELTARSLRTLDLFLTTLCERTGGNLPPNFVITLPKVEIAAQVSVLSELCATLEAQLGLAADSLQLELMIETPTALLNGKGEVVLSQLLEAANGRCRGIHFGAFDYTAACGITASYQDIRHPACEFARAVMQASVAGTGVWLADGVTTILPLEKHRGLALSTAQQIENRESVQRAWKIHYENIRHSLRCGFYQSWDLHPAQLIPRYVATYAFFLEGLDAASQRLRNFLAKAAQATTVGNIFDDAATGQGLLNYFVRAVHCGALDTTEAQQLTGLTMDELQSASFSTIIRNR